MKKITLHCVSSNGSATQAEQLLDTQLGCSAARRLRSNRPILIPDEIFNQEPRVLRTLTSCCRTLCRLMQNLTRLRRYKSFQAFYQILV